ncbi:MAG: helix-turn-helix transcriptional regulator [Deltaproteobacteria bacterium]|nr:helix-turn-helix transcriptional regulator [Deltaproteobacteria bacterium]
MDKGASRFLSTREVADYLGVNEKMVYTLVSEKGLPATKVTGKWRFPLDLVEKWLKSHVKNLPAPERAAFPEGLLVFAGSHDILLERTLDLFGRRNPDMLAVAGNVGSMGGIRALSAGLCQVAASHLVQEDEKDYNFAYLAEEMPGLSPAVVNFCRREQGLVVAKGNPLKLEKIADLAPSGARLANRPPGTGTRLHLDRELQKAGIDPPSIPGYESAFRGHMDAALEVLSGRADAACAIRPAAHLLNLDFIPLTWERFDLVTLRDLFFHRPFQQFLSLLKTEAFTRTASTLPGYDLSATGDMVFPEQR